MPNLNLTSDERRIAYVDIWDRWADAVAEKRKADARPLLVLHRKILRSKSNPHISQTEARMIRECLARHTEEMEAASHVA